MHLGIYSTAYLPHFTQCAVRVNEIGEVEQAMVNRFLASCAYAHPEKPFIQPEQAVLVTNYAVAATRFARLSRPACFCALFRSASTRRTAVEIWSDMHAPLEISA